MDGIRPGLLRDGDELGQVVQAALAHLGDSGHDQELLPARPPVGNPASSPSAHAAPPPRVEVPTGVRDRVVKRIVRSIVEFDETDDERDVVATAGHPPGAAGLGDLAVHGVGRLEPERRPAGAADELRQAWLVNRYDINAMKASMLEAFNAGSRELTRRMKAMRKTVRQHDVAAWAASFMTELSHVDNTHAKPVRPAKPRT